MISSFKEAMTSAWYLPLSKPCLFPMDKARFTLEHQIVKPINIEAEIEPNSFSQRISQLHHVHTVHLCSRSKTNKWSTFMVFIAFKKDILNRCAKEGK